MLFTNFTNIFSFNFPYNNFNILIEFINNFILFQLNNIIILGSSIIIILGSIFLFIIIDKINYINYAAR